MKAPRRPKKLRSHRRRLCAAALGFTGFAVLGVSYLSPPQTAIAPVRVARDYDSVLVPVPARGVARGEKLEAVEFVKIKWPKHHLTEQYLAAVDPHRSKVALAALPAYLPIPLAALGLAGADANAVVERIPEGMRAITVKVDPEAAVEGWAQSGNFVDVMVIRKGQDSADGMEAQVIAENVKILSAGRSVETNSGDAAPRTPATVTLLVNQDDALKIKTAAGIGKLTFSLRGVGDEQPTLSRAMTQRALLGSGTKLPVAKERFRGQARGPDGKRYILGPTGEWLRAYDAQ